MPNIIDINKLENVRTVAGGWQAACPCCRGIDGRDLDGNHLRIWSSNMAFNCIVAPGDREHNKIILQLAGSESDGTIEYDFREPPREKRIIYYQDDVLKKLIRDFSYWEKRGIKREVMESYEGGIALAGKLANRYVFVLRDTHGRIIGFNGRFIYPIEKGSKIVKYKLLGHKTLCLFDKARVDKEIQKSGVVWLSEGIGCLLAMRGEGLGCGFPCFGVKPSSTLLSHLVSLNPRKIVISFNNDSADKSVGQEAAEYCKNVLTPFFDSDRIIIRLPETGKDWMETTDEEKRVFKQEVLNN